MLGDALALVALLGLGVPVMTGAVCWVLDRLLPGEVADHGRQR